MGEEVRIIEYDGGRGGSGSGGDEDRVFEWEDGLPGFDDLAPLSQPLIPPELASAFRITADSPRTMLDVNRASKNTISTICGQFSSFPGTHHSYISAKIKSFEGENGYREQNPIVVDNEDSPMDLTPEGSDSRKVRRIEALAEEADSVTKNDCNSNNNNIVHNIDDNTNAMSASNDDFGSGKTVKRPRLVWTPQLHKRFVDVVAHLGIKNAVPKTIMQLMNVEGLTRENVASHLQKYRLYLKRMQGLSTEGPSASDHLFASTPVPQGLHESGGGGGSATGHGHHGQQQHNGNGHTAMPIPMPYPPPPPHMMHMPMIGMSAQGHGHAGAPPGGVYHGYEAHHHHHPQYNMMQHKFGSVPQYFHHVAPNDK